MNQKTLIELGKGILTVTLGVALYHFIAPQFKKTSEDIATTSTGE